MNDRLYEVLEYASEDGDNPVGRGKVIARDLTESQAEEMTERLYAPDRCWLMRPQETSGRTDHA